MPIVWEMVNIADISNMREVVMLMMFFLPFRYVNNESPRIKIIEMIDRTLCIMRCSAGVTDTLYLIRLPFHIVLCILFSTMEFAIIETGGKQYTVSKGDTIAIEKFSVASKEGDAVIFDKVLMVDNGKDTTIGTPYISKAVVKGKVTEVGRAAKITVVHYKQKSRYFKKNGHRQPFIKVLIESLK